MRMFGALAAIGLNTMSDFDSDLKGLALRWATQHFEQEGVEPTDEQLEIQANHIYEELSDEFNFDKLVG